MVENIQLGVRFLAVCKKSHNKDIYVITLEYLNSEKNILLIRLGTYATHLTEELKMHKSLMRVDDFYKNFEFICNVDDLLSRHLRG